MRPLNGRHPVARCTIVNIPLCKITAYRVCSYAVKRELLTIADSVDQHQTAQKLESDLRSALSDKEVFFSINKFEIWVVSTIRLKVLFNLSSTIKINPFPNNKFETLPN